jgi:hypothetical protein
MTSSTHQADQPSTDLGDVPGSPAYYGSNVLADAVSGQSGGAELPLSTVGEPPGSPAYYGSNVQADAVSAQPDGAALPLSMVGEPPGTSSYYGNTQDRRTPAQSEQQPQPVR